MKKLLILLTLLCLPSLAWAAGAIEVTAVPTVDLNSHAAGDMVGGKLTFTSGIGAPLSGKVITSIFTDEGKEGKNVELILFSSNPSSTTFTDNTALTIDDADLVKICGILPFTTHYAYVANGASRTNTSTGTVVCPNAGTTLYGAIVARETVTYDAVDALQVRLILELP